VLKHFVLKSAADLRRWRDPVDLSRGGTRASDAIHLDAAITWLMRSIAACNGRGSAKAYRIFDGWMPPYPETSGYIIPTLLELERAELMPGARHTTETIAVWLVNLQAANGGFRGGELGSGLDFDVFDTGMILLGFTALMHYGTNVQIEGAARRAAAFLLDSLDDSGCFVRHLSHGIVHAYNVRAAWGLVAYGKLTGLENFVQGGVANARWTVAQQNDLGFYRNNRFKPLKNANTHGIAYVMQGLIQIYKLTGEQALLDSVIRCASALADLYKSENWLAGEIAEDWTFSSHHVCLTGYSQMALVLDDLFRLTERDTWRRTSRSLVDQVSCTQELSEPWQPWYGGIAGSFPIFGSYAPFQYPNWATKFFIDALLSRQSLEVGNLDPQYLIYGG
jgi:hypothetical protein